MRISEGKRGSSCRLSRLRHSGRSREISGHAWAELIQVIDNVWCVVLCVVGYDPLYVGHCCWFGDDAEVPLEPSKHLGHDICIQDTILEVSWKEGMVCWRGGPFLPLGMSHVASCEYTTCLLLLRGCAVLTDSDAMCCVCPLCVWSCSASVGVQGWGTGRRVHADHALLPPTTPTGRDTHTH